MSMSDADMAINNSDICLKETKVLASLFQKIVENCKVATWKFYQRSFLFPETLLLFVETVLN